MGNLLGKLGAPVWEGVGSGRAVNAKVDSSKGISRIVMQTRLVRRLALI